MMPNVAVHESDSSAVLDSLLRPVLPTAYRVAYHLARNPFDAQDIVQDAALNATRAFHTFEQGTNFRAWFLRIVTNVFLGRYRRDRRGGGMLPLEDVSEAAEAERWQREGRLTEDPLGASMSRLETDEISEALQELPEEYRVVAVLYFLDDLPYQEIANIVGCPVGTVRSRLHRARALLKVRLRRLAAERGIGVARPAARTAPARVGTPVAA